MMIIGRHVQDPWWPITSAGRPITPRHDENMTAEAISFVAENVYVSLISSVELVISPVIREATSSAMARVSSHGDNA
jgi:hypothetical protein